MMTYDLPSIPLSPEHDTPPCVGVIMGSRSDWPIMAQACAVLHDFNVPYEARVVSAHRTPDRLVSYARDAKSRGINVIIAGAGGAAHLPGMCASMTPLPVFGVPVPGKLLSGVDSILSILQMPFGVPVGTLAAGVPGAKNAALLAISVLALQDEALSDALDTFRTHQTDKVPEYPADL